MLTTIITMVLANASTIKLFAVIVTLSAAAIALWRIISNHFHNKQLAEAYKTSVQLNKISDASDDARRAAYDAFDPDRLPDNDPNRRD